MLVSFKFIYSDKYSDRQLMGYNMKKYLLALFRLQSYLPYYINKPVNEALF